MIFNGVGIEWFGDSQFYSRSHVVRIGLNSTNYVYSFDLSFDRFDLGYAINDTLRIAWVKLS